MPDTDNLYYLTLLRHGESTGNASGIYQAQKDFPLTETGRRQSEALARYWKDQHVKFDRIVSSPLSRARETAEIIARELGLTVEIDPDLMERNAGLISGLRPDEAARVHPTPPFIHPYMPVAKTGESEWELFIRAAKVVQSLLHRPPGSYLLVSHGGLLNRVMHALLGVPPQANYTGPRFWFWNTGYTRLFYAPASHTWTLVSNNEHPHLPETGRDDGIFRGMEPLSAAQELNAEGDLAPGEEMLRPVPVSAASEPQPELRFTVRRADAGDVERLLPLFEEGDRWHRDALPDIFKKPASLESTRQWITSIFADPDSAIFTAETAAEMVGMVFVKLRQTLDVPVLVPRKLAVIDNLVVSGPHRRCGVGRALVEAAHRWAAENGAEEIELNVYEFNSPAIALYTSLGYQTLSRKMRLKPISHPGANTPE